MGRKAKLGTAAAVEDEVTLGKDNNEAIRASLSRLSKGREESSSGVISASELDSSESDIEIENDDEQLMREYADIISEFGEEHAEVRFTLDEVKKFRYKILSEEVLEDVKFKQGFPVLKRFAIQDIGVLYFRPLNFSEMDVSLNTRLASMRGLSTIEQGETMKNIISRTLVIPLEDADKKRVINYLIYEKPAAGVGLFAALCSDLFRNRVGKF